jgi:DNA-binding IclR family transcriptional regulator
MRLTPEQVSRLCGLERTATHDVLESLVEAGYLNRTDDGQYARPTDISTGRMALRQGDRRIRSRA